MNPINKFNAVALNQPKEIAVSDESSSLTYEMLFLHSNQLANFLISLEIKKGKRVGILTKRNVQLTKAILGVLKAGAVYVPLDPEYPSERIEYMISAAGLDTIIVDIESARLLKKTTEVNVIFLDDWIPLSLLSPVWKFHSKSSIDLCSCEDPKIEMSNDDSLVVLFTSGSTGQPKGVELSYGGYINNFANMQELLELKAGSKVAAMASQCFDISVTELWMPLLYGASIFIASDSTKKNPWALADWINHHTIDVIQFVPSLFQNFLIALEDEAITFPSIKKLLFIGEALRSHLINKWFARFGDENCKVYNLYGPVEASIEVSVYIIDKNTVLTREVVPIGKPFSGVEFILKNQLSQNILFIKGIQVAKGYLNPEQSAKAFIDQEYCTGDVVEKLESGDFFFLRRKDRQIKIRGFRVELEEIENTLISCPGIKEAAVIVKQQENNDKIIACLKSSETEETVATFLRKKLPNYMIPHQFVFLSSLPLNQNGKVNYNELEKAF